MSGPPPPSARGYREGAGEGLLCFRFGHCARTPELAAAALLQLVDSDEPPLRLLLGSMVYDLAFDIARGRMDTWAAWEDVSRAAERAISPPVA
ncbi:hypothetical protein [Streptomyces sp. NPDC048269]|uniref:hypothetical protein n=1 Tax=Streptomyces sp. NPDC048269 TaxID=3155753 RepID=UPI00343F3F5E